MNNIIFQTHLGIWELNKWLINESATQLPEKHGIYCIKNKINNKVLIGEGILGGHQSRISSHFRKGGQNISWNKDVEKYGLLNFSVEWIILEEDEIQRKLIENKLQIHFKDNCYNLPRKKYPTQKELLVNIDRINNYTIIEDCWESNYDKQSKYAKLSINNKGYKHHIMMYILHYGDICGISSIINHKCKNKRCINPKHLELTTHINNLNYLKNKNNKKIEKKIITGVTKVKNGYCCKVKLKNKHYNLGIYTTEDMAKQNRDYFIVKNNLLAQSRARLNYHTIDYKNFKPWPQIGGKINKYLV